MSLYYKCKDGDALDMICKNIYGYSRSSVEAVLANEKNREIAKKMPLLEAGDVVYLPDLPKPEGPTIYTNLWN